MYWYKGKTREKSKVISGETSLNLLAEERFCGLHIRELKQPRRRRRQECYKFAYLTMKNSSFARFARAVFIFGHLADVLVPFTT